MIRTRGYQVDLDPTGGLLSWHPDLASYLGYQMSDFIGATIYDFVAVEDAANLGEVRFQALLTPTQEHYVRFRIRDRYGDLHWVEALDWGSVMVLRILGLVAMLREMKAPPFRLVAGPETQSPWVAWDPEDRVLAYGAGISVRRFWELAEAVLPECELERFRRFLRALFVSDVADLSPRNSDQLARVPLIEGQALTV